MNETIMSVTDFKSEASRWLRELHQHEQTFILTQNGRASAVVLDYAQYQRQQRSLLMMKLMVQGEADIQQGRLHAQDTLFDEVKTRLESPSRSDNG